MTFRTLAAALFLAVVAGAPAAVPARAQTLPTLPPLGPDPLQLPNPFAADDQPQRGGAAGDVLGRQNRFTAPREARYGTTQRQPYAPTRSLGLETPRPVAGGTVR